jgi:hypothetical protein
MTYSYFVLAYAGLASLLTPHVADSGISSIFEASILQVDTGNLQTVSPSAAGTGIKASRASKDSAVAVKRSEVPNESRPMPQDTERDTNTSTVKNQIHLAFPAGVFLRSPMYVGNLADSVVAGVSGSQGSPTTTSGAAGVFEKFSKSHASNALAGIAYKYGNRYEDRTTGVFGEAVDKVGGFGSFVEGIRGQGTLIDGSAGAAYGAICSAGIDPHSGANTFRLLVGCEGETDNTTGPDAPTFERFSRDHFAITFVASNGVGSGKRYKADAGFWTNSYSLAQFQTGFLCSSAVADTCLAATRDTAVHKGIDLSLASISYATLIAPNNAPIRFANAAGTAKLNVLTVDTSDVVQLGADASRVNVPSGLTARSYGVGPLAGVSCPAGTVNLATLTITNGIVTHC